MSDVKDGRVKVMNRLTQQLRDKDREIIKLQERVNRLSFENEQMKGDLNRYREHIKGNTVYQTSVDMAIEIDAEEYISQYPSSDGVRRHAFKRGAQSVIDKIKVG